MSLPERIRAFVAVPIPDAQREQLAEVQQAMRGQFRQVSWTRPEAMHLTLLFLGDIESSAVPVLAQRLGDAAAAMAPFDLELGEPGSFGERVLWIGLRQGARELTPLAEKVRDAAQEFGNREEERAFHGHVTLGRAQRRGGLASGLARCPRPAPFAPWTAREIELLRSELHPKGARYSILGRFALAG